MLNSKINIYFRIKPYTPMSINDKNIIRYNEPNILSIKNNKPRVHNRNYWTTYKNKNILNNNYDNNAVYEKTIKNKILNHNENLLIIAYGQTGSGKTHTLVGNNNEYGLIPIIIKDLIDTNQDIECSAVEVYKNVIFDILRTKKQSVNILEYNKHLHYTTKLESNKIKSMIDLKNIMQTIQSNKKIGSTKLNDLSSRSHTIYFFYNKTSNKKIIAIDLAGNEKGSLSLAKDKEDYKEYISINQSLFALKECIRSLYQKKQYIPFRRSKLTLLLREILTDNINLTFIGTLNPSLICYSDIIDTIEYGLCLKNANIKKFIKQNEDTCNFREIEKPLKKLIRRLSEEDLKKNKSLSNSISEPSLSKINKNEFLRKYFRFIIKHYEIAEEHRNIYKLLDKKNTKDKTKILDVIDIFTKITEDFKLNIH